MSDIVERLRNFVAFGDDSDFGASDMAEDAVCEIERLRTALRLAIDGLSADSDWVYSYEGQRWLEMDVGDDCAASGGE